MARGAPFAKGDQVRPQGIEQLVFVRGQPRPQAGELAVEGLGQVLAPVLARSTPSGEPKARLAPSSFSSSTTGPLRMSSASAGRHFVVARRPVASQAMWGCGESGSRA